MIIGKDTKVYVVMIETKTGAWIDHVFAQESDAKRRVEEWNSKMKHPVCKYTECAIDEGIPVVLC